MYSSSSLVKRFANSFSYSARVSSGVAILNMRYVKEKNPQITRKQLYKSTPQSPAQRYREPRVTKPGYQVKFLPGLATKASRLRNAIHQSRNYYFLRRFCLQCFLFSLFAAVVGSDENTKVYRNSCHLFTVNNYGTSMAA